MLVATAAIPMLRSAHAFRTNCGTFDSGKGSNQPGYRSVAGCSKTPRPPAQKCSYGWRLRELGPACQTYGTSADERRREESRFRANEEILGSQAQSEQVEVHKTE